MGRQRHAAGGMALRPSISCARLAFSELGLHRIYAYVLAINPRAQRAFERAGFALEGKLRDDRWVDDRFVDAYLLAQGKPSLMLHVIYDGQCGFCIRSLKVCRGPGRARARCDSTTPTRGSR